MSAARRLLLQVVIVLPLGFALAGCETFEKLNPFAERQTPLPGVRKPLFPEGVPGVEFGAAPPQPSNSNIPITPAITSSDNPQGQAQGAQPPAQTQAARNPQPVQSAQPAPQPAPAAKSSKASKASDPDDAWAGTR